MGFSIVGIIVISSIIMDHGSIISFYSLWRRKFQAHSKYFESVTVKSNHFSPKSPIYAWKFLLNGQYHHPCRHCHRRQHWTLALRWELYFNFFFFWILSYYVFASPFTPQIHSSTSTHPLLLPPQLSHCCLYSWVLSSFAPSLHSPNQELSACSLTVSCLYFAC